MCMVAYILNGFFVDKCSMGDKRLRVRREDGGSMVAKLRGRVHDERKDEWEKICQACYEDVPMADQ